MFQIDKNPNTPIIVKAYIEWHINYILEIIKDISDIDVTILNGLKSELSQLKQIAKNLNRLEKRFLDNIKEEK